MDMQDSRTAFLFILMFMYITSCYFIVKYLVVTLHVRVKLRYVFIINWVWGIIVFGLAAKVMHHGGWDAGLFAGGCAALLATCWNEKFASSSKKTEKN